MKKTHIKNGIILSLEQQALAMAKVRKEMMKSLAKTDPRKFLNLVLGEQKRSGGYTYEEYEKQKNN